MKFKPLHTSLFVSRQVQPDDLRLASSTGFRLIISTRPDDEEPGQPSASDLAAIAAENGMTFVHLPIAGEITDADVAAMETAIRNAKGPTLAYCRSGNRSARIGALALATRVEPQRLVANAARSGYEIGDLTTRLSLRFREGDAGNSHRFDVVIVGGGSAGIATAASLLRRQRSLRIAIVEPSLHHYYQPGWTMVGAGLFSHQSTKRRMSEVIPKAATWIRGSVVSFQPEENRVRLEDGRLVDYDVLVVATGLTLDWDAIPGLKAALGQNGVTSNYRFDLAPYTAKLVDGLRDGRAVFTQPPMPIKCAGAPQKAMYLSCDAWRRSGRLNTVDVSFHTANAALFGVAAYVPALMRYVDRYGVDLRLSSELVAVDGARRTATFERLAPDGTVMRVVEPFELLHVCPPQVAPAAVASSPLAGPGGFIDVDAATLRHPRFPNVFALGDVAATTNAKTVAAARKQAPVVAENVLAVFSSKPSQAIYDGYGSCPLTVERGRIVLAEFGYGGKLLPSFPRWLINGTRPSRLAWFLKESVLPKLYWHGMLKGREWLARPRKAA